MGLQRARLARPGCFQVLAPRFASRTAFLVSTFLGAGLAPAALALRVDTRRLGPEFARRVALGLMLKVAQLCAHRAPRGSTRQAVKPQTVTRVCHAPQESTRLSVVPRAAQYAYRAGTPP